MNRLQQIIAYLCVNYPHKSELSKARLTKMVYLSDWFSALLDGRQLTNIDWLFNHYGPYVDDVIGAAHNGSGFMVINETTMYGSHKNVISFQGDVSNIQLTDREKVILDAVIDKTKNLCFNDFIDYVYSTYPVKKQERYSNLNLVSLAQQFRESRT
ncbi:Panacea domain-containing protein [Endozoicomonas sp. YOMI1]|uniref:Panacea domain-containing protein n=1 Tax=Endozoicomonas sp. YOMI1 TaxID=2828739 RepID=UPI0021486736|nr:Panacea domain-containing protein [Endozoicomonas sp. YOMI1]